MRRVDVLLLQLLGKVWLEGEVYAPIGVAYLAASLRAAGYRVHSKRLGPRVLARPAALALGRMRPRLIGISSTGNEIAELKRISLDLRRMLPDVPLVAGGYCSLEGARLFEGSAIDIVAVGEGEATIRELAGLFCGAATPERGRLHDIKGIVFRNESGGAVSTPVRPPVADLDHLPPPDYGHLPRTTSLIRVYASRGCPFDCSFCEIKDFYPSKRIRYHGAAYMKALVARLIAKAPRRIEVVCFNDDEFLLVPGHLEAMAGVARELGVKISFQTRTRDVPRHRRAIAAHADAIHQVHMGVESFSQSQLDRWHKRATTRDNAEALSVLAELGVSYYPYVILSDQFTTVAELAESCAGLVAMPPCPYPVRHAGRAATVTLSPIRRGIHLNRMKNFRGDVETAPQTRFLEAAWRFLQATSAEARRLSGICAHAALAEGSRAAERAGTLLEARIAALPGIAAQAEEAIDSAAMIELADARSRRFCGAARAIRLDYMAAALAAPRAEPVPAEMPA